MISKPHLARRFLPGAVLTAVVGVVVVVVGVVQSSAARVVAGVLVFLIGAAVAVVARRTLLRAGEGLLQVTVPPR